MHLPRLARLRRCVSFANTRQVLLQLLLAIALAGAVYRYYWLGFADLDKCNAIQKQGEWLDPISPPNDSQSFENWQPPGCMMHTYTKKDIETCFAQRKLVLVGDSTVRQIFWAIAHKMDRDRTEVDSVGKDAKHGDLQFKSAGATIQFIWDPWMNSSALEREIYAFNPISSTESTPNYSSALILVGAPGLWYARYGPENTIKGYRETVDVFIRNTNHGSAKKTTRKASFHRRMSTNLLFVAPVQVPEYLSLSPEREATITPAKIDNMNHYLQQTSASALINVMWSFSLMPWQVKKAYSEGGIHVVDSIAHRKADVLLNMRCNSEAASKGYPFDGTCCMSYTRPAIAQFFMLLSGLLVLPALSFLQRFRVVRTKLYLPKREIHNSLVTLLWILCFCFWTDRTQIFEKVHKQFQINQLIAWSIMLLVLGLSSLSNLNNSSTDEVDCCFLSRNQTAEWKGWMQAGILVYHYTGASKSLQIYQVIRILVASYLFMTGYGHTLSFLDVGDYTLKRATQVLIRLNLLPVALSYMMATDYLFYYFPALISFWFMVIYCVLQHDRNRNSTPYFVILKIALSSLITTAITFTPGFLELIGFLLRVTCRISWDVVEWRFRFGLDQYIVYIGMLAALFHDRSRHLPKTRQAENLFDEICQIAPNVWYHYNRVISCLAGVVFCCFWAFASQFHSKTSYNRWQPYISSIPVLCFIILRNSSRTARNSYSTIFAWLGRYSLETYVLQYHIWLAGDAKGLLRLGVFHPSIEFVILTILFLWLSACTGNAIRKLTEWMVGPDDPVGVNHSPMIGDEVLPTTRFSIEASSPANGRSINSDLTSPRPHTFGGWLANYERLLREDLRWRLFTVALVLWLANITYW